MPNLAEVARSPVPDEAFEQYPNQWVAIRNGKVVAAADTDAELIANPEVHPNDDTLYHVPSSASFFY